MPTPMVPWADGTRFPLIPPITTSDLTELPENIRSKLIDPAEKDIPASMEEL